MAKAPQTTEPRVTVLLEVEIECPKCGKRMQRREKLNEEALRTGNTTQRAEYWAAQMKQELENQKRRALWDGEKCGACLVETIEATQHLIRKPVPFEG